MLVLANASKPNERTIGLASVTVFGILVTLLNFAMVAWRSGMSADLISQMSPAPMIVQSLGTLACIFALIARGKFGRLAVATLLSSIWFIQMMGNSRNLAAISIAFLGGGIIICLVNYLQRSGLWVRWSAETADGHSLESS